MSGYVAQQEKQRPVPKEMAYQFVPNDKNDPPACSFAIIGIVPARILRRHQVCTRNITHSSSMGVSLTRKCRGRKHQLPVIRKVLGPRLKNGLELTRTCEIPLKLLSGR